MEDVEVFAHRSSHSRQFFRVLSKIQITLLRILP